MIVIMRPLGYILNPSIEREYEFTNTFNINDIINILYLNYLLRNRFILCVPFLYLFLFLFSISLSIM